MSGDEKAGPTLADIERARERLHDRILDTPVHAWRTDFLKDHLPAGTEVSLKLELLQHGGSFKARGALINLMSLDDEARRRGVTAFSAGNHAIAVSYAAREVGSTAKVVMPKSANPARVARSQAYGSEVVLVDTIAEALERVEEIQEKEGRTFVHPYEGRNTILGTATVGLDIMRQLPDTEAIVVPVGGGGLIAGISTAVRLVNPDCKIYGVEPTGACSMRRSLDHGQAMEAEEVKTIADSLGAPRAMPYGFSLVRQNVEDIVLVSDNQMRWGMKVAFDELKLGLEPAPAAGLAALFGPLCERLAGKRVCLVVCGSNIDIETWHREAAAAPDDL